MLLQGIGPYGALLDRLTAVFAALPGPAPYRHLDGHAVTLPRCRDKPLNTAPAVALRVRPPASAESGAVAQRCADEGDEETANCPSEIEHLLIAEFPPEAIDLFLHARCSLIS